MIIPFTQYMMPDGRKKKGEIDRPDSIGQKAADIIAHGYRFEIEMLSTSFISMTIFNIKTEEDDEIQVVSNGPEVPIALDRMIERFALLMEEA